MIRNDGNCSDDRAQYDARKSIVACHPDILPCCRRSNSNLRLAPCRSATSATEEPVRPAFATGMSLRPSDDLER